MSLFPTLILAVAGALGLAWLIAPAAPASANPPSSRPLLRWPALRLRSRVGWSELAGPEDGYGSGQVAVSGCRSPENGNGRRFISAQRGSCQELQLVHGGERACAWACLGEGDCVRACGEGAIHLEAGLPVVDPGLCSGCGDCVLACPRQVLLLMPAEAQLHLGCQSRADAAERAVHCERSCRDSERCLESRFLPAGLVGSREGRRVVDYSRSANLLPLLSLCPSGSFVDRIAHRPWFTVNESCTGCGDCLPLCPAADCILPDGPPADTPLGRARVRIVPEACTGCGLCLPACAPKAIRVVGALGYGTGGRRDW
ncbi:MAG: 4Fe-4S binding protein [bacterium]|nr:4Fe-4S binding protein [bacterium]